MKPLTLTQRLIDIIYLIGITPIIIYCLIKNL